MIHEIKFRAWDKENEKMIHANDILAINFEYQEVKYQEVYQVDYDELGRNIDILKFEDMELMQYTGLKDIYEIEVYEGDIVISNTEQNVDHLCVVEWDKKALQWQLKAIRKLKGEYIGELVAQMGEGAFKHCRVVGDIYNHKELLQ